MDIHRQLVGDGLNNFSVNSSNSMISRSCPDAIKIYFIKQEKNSMTSMAKSYPPSSSVSSVVKYLKFIMLGNIPIILKKDK